MRCLFLVVCSISLTKLDRLASFALASASADESIFYFVSVPMAMLPLLFD